MKNHLKHPTASCWNPDESGSFEQFCLLCQSLRDESSHKIKSQHISSFIKLLKTNDGSSEELHILFRFLLPKESKRIYNLKDKQLINLFSEIFQTNKEEMLETLKDSEDVAFVIGEYFSSNDIFKPLTKSILSMFEVDKFCDKLAALSKDSDRLDQLKNIIRKCSCVDLITIVRVIRQDLRVNTGTKQVLDGLNPKAYAAFQASRDLKSLIHKVTESTTVNVNTSASQSSSSTTSKTVKNSNDSNTTLIKRSTSNITISMNILTPVKPMLAEACRSTAQALAKCDSVDGLLVEIKYDGERVQIHKKGKQFAFYSRSLKCVPKSKITHLESHIPNAFHTAEELVIDSEILLMDTVVNKPLPFGTLGVHKRTAFENATVCLFVFDCLFWNGQSLMHKTIKERRQILEENITEIKNHVQLSEKHIIKDEASLNVLMAHVFENSLEGLVLKPMNSIYEPGKRHWLKIKRDYLADGAMADSVDLIVLGGYYGTGNKAGLISVFLMGAYDKSSKQFCTVTKCGNGFTDEMLERFQREIMFTRLENNTSKIPNWLNVSKSLIPDVVVTDPKNAPVWEITGAEFSRAGNHTAGLKADQTQGISIRFPRLTKERSDKLWSDATTVNELENLVNKSKQSTTDWLKTLTNANNNNKNTITKQTSTVGTMKRQSNSSVDVKLQKPAKQMKLTQFRN